MRLQSGNSDVDGRGVGIAVVDSSIFTSHRSFQGADGQSRVLAEADFTGLGISGGDPYGHGTHVAALAGGGSREIPEAYEGIAPGAHIINLRVLNSQGQGTVSSLLSALDWIMTRRATYNIRVVNLSLGCLAIDSYKNDPVCRAVRRLVDAGIVVVAAAGNNGKDSAGQKVYGLIHSPGNEPSAITVGATNTFGTDGRSDDDVATYSSRGPTRSYSTTANGVRRYDNLLKPDLVAPGNKLISAEARDNVLASTNPELEVASTSGNDEKKMMYLSGSSAAAPIISGAAALMLQVNPKLTPNLIKAILMYTAQPLAGYNMFEQGAGQVNIEGALRLARLVRTDLSSSTPLGSRLLTTTNLPVPQSWIAGQNLSWGQGIILGQTYATGTELITKYQLIYALTYLLADGDLEWSGRLIANPTTVTGGITLGNYILISDGHLLADGLPFLSVSSLLGDGHLLSDGHLLGDGHLLSDGHLLADQNLLADAKLQALVALIQGDR
jgi:subtilisin family serine protease